MDIKAYIISWLDWAANWARDDPYDFLSRRMCVCPLALGPAVLPSICCSVHYSTAILCDKWSAVLVSCPGNR